MKFSLFFFLIIQKYNVKRKEKEDTRFCVRLRCLMQFIKIGPASSEKNAPIVCSVTQEAREYLSQLHQPIAVVCSTGPFRCHKSWLMSHLLDPEALHKPIFSVSASMSPHTRGLWIAPKLLDRTNILLVDTEGLNAPGSTETIDTNILAFAIILAAKILFSSKGRIDSTAFDSLQSAVVMASWFNNKATEENNNEPMDMFASKPHLLWVLRDVGLQMPENENKQTMTPTQYLNDQLNHADPNLRSSVEQLFQSRVCVPMVYPVKNDAHLEDMHPKNLTPAFKRDIQVIKDAVYATQPKKIRNQDVSGPVLLAMADVLCSILSKGGTPVLAPIWKTAALAANAEMREQIVQTFTKKLQMQYSSQPHLNFWNLQDLKSQMLTAIQTWASKQSFSQPEDAVMLIDTCWQHIENASKEKLEQWKVAVQTPESNIDDEDGNKSVSQLIPESLREIMLDMLKDCAKAQFELKACKIELQEAIDAIENAKKWNVGTMKNEDDVRMAQSELQRTQNELNDIIASYNVFEEVVVERTKNLKQTVTEQKLELQACAEKEELLKQELAKLQHEKNDILKQKQLHQVENEKLVKELASESKKRKTCETAVSNLNDKVIYLQTRKEESDNAFAHVSTEHNKLRADNLKLKMLANTRDI